MKPYYEDDSVTIYHGDCREILPTLGGIGLVVTDPPYVFGIASTANETKAGGWGDLMNSASFYASWIRECRKLIDAKQGAMWCFNSWRSFPVLARASYEAQWPIESLLVWDKEWIGPGGQRGLRPSYELAALFAHPDFQLPDRGTPDIWRHAWSPGRRETIHAAEKPAGLYGRMIRQSAVDGVVLDPFMGSGSCLIGAKNEGYHAIGIEIEERYCEIAAKRCAQDVLVAV